MEYYECLADIININGVNKKLYSTFLIRDNNKNYIITGYYSLKIIDFNGNKIKDIKDFNKKKTYYIDTYLDKKLFKKYIITGNENYIKSYDYNENKLYHKYSENDNSSHLSIVINDKEEIIKLIDSSWDGNIRIWDFHSGILLNKIKVGKCRLYGICLWDNENLFVGCDDKVIKQINLKNSKIVKNLSGHNNTPLTIKKIIHPLYGKCLITQGYFDDQIKIWSN